MSKDDHIHLFAKYSAVLQWLQEISSQGIAAVFVQFFQIQPHYA